MYVTYKPEDGDQQRWEWDPDRVRQPEAEMIEKRYGGGRTWDQFKAGVMSNDSRARRVLLWHLLRREHHNLRYEDVPAFYMGELVVEFNVGEIGVMRDRIMKATMADDEREQMLTGLDMLMADAIALDSDLGKADSNSAA